MRALAAAVLLLALLPVPSSAHPTSDCVPPSPVPSLGMWMLRPGATLSYFVPRDHVASALAAAPVDVTLYSNPACEIDPSCHRHAAPGLASCVAREFSTFQVHNPAPDAAPVILFIGPCKYAVVMCGMGTL